MTWVAFLLMAFLPEPPVAPPRPIMTTATLKWYAAKNHVYSDEIVTAEKATVWYELRHEDNQWVAAYRISYVSGSAGMCFYVPLPCGGALNDCIDACESAAKTARAAKEKL